MQSDQVNAKHMHFTKFYSRSNAIVESLLIKCNPRKNETDDYKSETFHTKSKDMVDTQQDLMILQRKLNVRIE